MKTLSKSVVKAKALEVFRSVEQTGEEVVITSNGKPVLKIVPYQEAKSVGDAFGDLRSAYQCMGDLTEPTLAEWGEV